MLGNKNSARLPISKISDIGDHPSNSPNIPLNMLPNLRKNHASKTNFFQLWLKHAFVKTEYRKRNKTNLTKKH